MCGIAGILGPSASDNGLLRKMGDRLAHRGPDGEGIWQDRDAGIGFSHRRLAIMDLSAAGHQPMQSRNGRYVLNYNGEIYNHARVRSELDRADATPEAGWAGHSDTETLVEAIAAWGLEPALAKCAGMFGFAVWDRQERALHLVRDRFGEKPLYYGWVGGNFVFASELKAIRALPNFDNPINRRAAALFARLGNVPAPHSIFEHIYKLEPGCILTGTADTLKVALDAPPVPGTKLMRRYWSYRDVVLGGLADPIHDPQEAVERLSDVLGHAVREQAIADVPVGVFLSGGIDSSTIAALYRQHSPVKTFTVGFEEAAFDEAPHARAVARHLGTDHYETCITAHQAQEVIPLLPSIYDEPFADSSQVPTFLVSKFAREQVTVALTGDGGDETFGGYNRYVAAPRLWAHAKKLPLSLRAGLVGVLGQVPPSVWNVLADWTGRDNRQPHFGGKVQKTLRTMAVARGIDDLHDSFVDEWHTQRSPMLGDEGRLPSGGLGSAAPDAVRMMYRDAISYLPDDILTKVDRAAMAVSLETRVPLLDHRVAELAARIPLAMKISGGTGKQALRKLLYRYAPPALFDRSKTGFAVPVGEWLKGPLRPWAEELLDEGRMRSEGLLDATQVRHRWKGHLEGRDSTAAIWHVLMFQAWLNSPV